MHRSGFVFFGGAAAIGGPTSAMALPHPMHHCDRVSAFALGRVLHRQTTTAVLHRRPVGRRTWIVVAARPVAAGLLAGSRRCCADWNHAPPALDEPLRLHAALIAQPGGLVQSASYPRAEPGPAQAVWHPLAAERGPVWRAWQLDAEKCEPAR